MPVLHKVTEPFSVTADVVDVFKVLGYPDLNSEEARQNTKAKAARTLLFSVGFTNWETAYRGILVRELVHHKEVVDTAEKKTAVSDVLAAAHYLMTFESDPTTHWGVEEPKFHQVVSAIGSSGSGTGTESRGSKTYSVGDLPEFSGQDSEWALWKEQALAQFKIDKLTKVITDEDYARLHPIANTVVHGMLTKALAAHDGYGFVTCIHENHDNGHKAWETLCGYYEHHVLISNVLNDLHKRLNELSLTSVKDFESFHQEFFWLKTRITMLEAKAVAHGLQAGNRIPSWKTEFLNKIKVQALLSRAESCRGKTDMDVWVTMLSLKDAIHETERESPTKPKGNNNNKRKDVHNDEGKGNGSNKRQEQMDPRLLKLFNGLKNQDDPEFVNKLKGMLDQPDKKNGKKKRFRKRRKATNKNNDSIVDIESFNALFD